MEFEVADDFGLDGDVGEAAFDVCDLLIFLVGGC